MPHPSPTGLCTLDSTNGQNGQNGWRRQRDRGKNWISQDKKQVGSRLTTSLAGDDQPDQLFRISVGIVQPSESRLELVVACCLTSELICRLISDASRPLQMLLARMSGAGCMYDRRMTITI